MALIKSMPDPTATPGTMMPEAYIRWASLTVEPIARTIRATFAVYRNQAARDAGVPPFEARIAFGMSGDDYDAFTIGQSQAADSIGALVYGFAKAQPDLADAVDVV